MQPEAATDFVLALAREHKLKDMDLLQTRSEKLTLRVNKGRIEKVDQSTAQGIGVRVVQDGRTGVAFTERFEPAALEKAFRAARENAQLQDPTEVLLAEPPPPVPDPESLGLYTPALDDLTAAQLAEFALAAEAAARGADKRVTSVPALVVSRDSGWYEVASTHGVKYRQRANSIGAYCQVLLEDKGQRKSGNASWAQREWRPAAAQEMGRLATSRGVALLGARAIAGRKIPVVLDAYCAPGLLGMYFGAFSAEASQKGQSRLKGRLNEQIAVEDFTLLDEPHRVGGPGSRFVDAEGIPTRTLPLVEHGRFANFLYHIESARKEGKTSTGHAGRGHSTGITTRSHNLVMPAGKHSLDELAALESRCLLVTELEGGAGCNPLSGDISIGVQGFLMENGKRVQPVDSVTIAGNFYDLLKSIRATGRDYQPNLSRLFIPPLLVDGLSLAG